MWRLLFGAAVLGLAAGSAAAQVRCEAVGPNRIHACVHAGSGPTLVLAAGAGQDSRTWSPLVERMKALGSVVTFDRPGLGQSPSIEGPRTPTTIAQELREVLLSLDLPGPVILIGHSMGGIHALRFADLFPEAVGAVVLLDTPPPDFEQDRMKLLSAEAQEQRKRMLATGRSRAPAIVGRERDGASAERWVFEGFPADVPLLVVVADSQEFGDVDTAQVHRDLWVRQSSRWTKLSSNAEFMIAHGSGHMVHHDRGPLVLDIVARAVDLVSVDGG